MLPMQSHTRRQSMNETLLIWQK